MNYGFRIIFWNCSGGMVFFVFNFIDRAYLPKVITETSLVCTILDIYVFLTNGLCAASVMSGVVYIQILF